MEKRPVLTVRSKSDTTLGRYIFHVNLTLLSCGPGCWIVASGLAKSVGVIISLIILINIGHMRCSICILYVKLLLCIDNYLFSRSLFTFTVHTLKSSAGGNKIARNFKSCCKKKKIPIVLNASI